MNVKRNKKPRARVAHIFGSQRGKPFITLGRKEGLNLGYLEVQEIHPQRTSGGAPFPLMVLTFDDLIADTAPNYYEAGKMYAGSSFCTVKCSLPTPDEFRALHDSEDYYSILYRLGISRQVPYIKVWKTYLRFFNKVERKTPTQLYPWVRKVLESIITRFHLIIVTSNRSHDIAKIIKTQTGIKSGFDVVVVPAQNMDLVFATLADYHLAHHHPQNVGIPFNIFCSSARDAESAGMCGNLVHTYGVVGEFDYGDGGNYSRQSLARNGAIPITPDQILSIVYGYGLYTLGCGKFKLSAS